MADTAEVLASQLLNLKRQIETDKEKKARLEGQLTSLMDRLKKDFGCSTLQEAEVKLKKLDREIEKLQESVKGKIDGIRREYATSA